MADDDDRVVYLEPPKRRVELPHVMLAAGELPRIVRESMKVLQESDLPAYTRAGNLMCPIVEEVAAADSQITLLTRLHIIGPDLLVRWLAESADYLKFDGRARKMVPVDVPRRVATTLLASEDIWEFNRVAAVLTSPLMRPDRSLLREPGYDQETQLILVEDRELHLPPD
jgi:putative DNA primase/helicase